MSDQEEGEEMKKIIKTTSMTLALLLMTVLASSSVYAEITHTTSSHNFVSLIQNVEVGEENLNTAKSWIEYINAHEVFEGTSEKIESNAYFYKPYDTTAQKPLPVMTVSANPSDALPSVYEIANSKGLIDTVRIQHSSVGFARLKGKFRWDNTLTNTSLKAPTVIHDYPFQVDIYTHMKASGIRLTSKAAKDADTMNLYCYKGYAETIKVAMLPFNQEYVKWDKAGNNAIQYFNISNANNDVVNATKEDDDWDEGKLTIKALEEGNSSINVINQKNADIHKTINVKVFNKPEYELSASEINLAENAVVKPVSISAKNVGKDNEIRYKWVSSNPKIVEVTNENSNYPTFKTKEAGDAVITCTCNDEVTLNNSTEGAVNKKVTIHVKKDADLKNKIITSNNTYIANGDVIRSSREGDEVFVRVEEAGEEAVLSYESSNEKVCTVTRSNRRGYSFVITKKGRGLSRISVYVKNGKRIEFDYIAETDPSPVVDPYSSVVPNKVTLPKKPKFSLKCKKRKLTVKVKKDISKYNATKFEIQIKRGKKTVYKKNFQKTTLKTKKFKKGKYTVFIRTCNGVKNSAWCKKKVKIK